MCSYNVNAAALETLPAAVHSTPFDNQLSQSQNLYWGFPYDADCSVNGSALVDTATRNCAGLDLAATSCGGTAVDHISESD